MAPIHDCLRGRSRRRAAVALVLVIAGFLAAFADAPRLLLTDNPFGALSLIGEDPPIGAPFDRIVLVGLAAGLLPIPFLRNPRRWILLWCAAFLARCAWDAAAWQPYFLQYWFFLLALALVPWRGRETDEERVDGILDALRLGMIAIYVHSGLAKLHHEFLVDAGPAMLQPLTGRLGMEAGPVLAAVLPIGEIAAAVMLLLPRARLAGLLGLVAMHVYVLAIIGPLGSGANQVVWPWNIVMIGLVITLFWRTRLVPAAALLRGGRWPTRHIAIALFVVAPCLSYVGMWPTYLGYRLYAQRYDDGFILLKPAAIDRLPADVREHVVPQDLAPYSGHIKIKFWAEAHINAIVPQDAFVFERLALRFLAWCETDTDVALVIREPARLPWTTERRETLRTLRQLRSR